MPSASRRPFTAIPLALFLLLASAPGAASDPPAGEVVPSSRADSPLALSEILAGPARDWDGSGTFSTRDDEWVEVWNRGAAPLDLAPFLLTDGDSIPRFAFAGTLAPGGRLVISGKDSYDWERATGHPAYGLSLGNTGDSVLLWEVVGAETLLVEGYAYRGHEAAADRSVARMGDGEWRLFDGLNPYTGTIPPQGNGCEPTPSADNLCGTTHSRSLTWGRLKDLYRR